MLKIGHQSCKKFIRRDYSGAPFLADDGETCVYITKGAESVCDDVKYDTHQPLCYCSKFLLIKNIFTRL